ncbi:hypothetical protein [Histidinibacterium lentulum]|uniref:Uncharacterized protein n=1 Tax=Histidinibacterium lentulum TaxID=2480588 RepID=A0A3N2R510_9RHOB|nr:hypothetical protein [Histidinibacterium lentulum]ROU02514.1 hypothetical protein EAT49_09250 [Histidinibacterium lentulum]
MHPPFFDIPPPARPQRPGPRRARSVPVLAGARRLSFAPVPPAEPPPRAIAPPATLADLARPVPSPAANAPPALRRALGLWLIRLGSRLAGPSPGH